MCGCVQERVGRPEQLDASVMVNPDNADTSEMDPHSGHRYNAVGAAEPIQSQAGSAFHVRHPFPFAPAASQLPAPTFTRLPNVDYCPPAVTAPGNPTSVFDGGFNPVPFSQQFSGNVSGDRNASLYQTSVDAVRPVGMSFDNFSNFFRSMPPPVSVSNSSNYYTSCQPMSYTAPSSTFMSRADGVGFGSELQSSSGYSSSHPWPPAPDIHRPTFGQFSRFPVAPRKASVDDFCGALLHNSAVGSDSMSSGSPITDLLDHRNSPTQLPGAAYGCAVTLPSSSLSDLVESVRHTVAVSPFCPSPVDSLQLSRSLPSGVRFGRSAFTGDTAAVATGHHPPSRMHFDGIAASLPLSNRSFFQPVSIVGDPDDRTASGTGFQVYSMYIYMYVNPASTSPVNVFYRPDAVPAAQLTVSKQ